MELNATFNNISVILWLSVVLADFEIFTSYLSILPNRGYHMGRFDSIVYHFQNFVFQKPELTQKIETEAASTSQAKDVEEDSPVPSPQGIADQGEETKVHGENHRPAASH
jgi:hypothetical protein